MEDQVQETVVDAPVDAVQTQETNETPISSGQETGVTIEPEVAAQVTDEKDFGPALKAELARREAQMEKKYGERAQQAEQYQKNLERIAKYYGYETHDAYMEDLDQAERDRTIRQEAEKYGVPEDFIRQELAPLKSEIETLRQEREKLQRQETHRQVEAEIASMKTKYPDFEQYQDKVFDMVVKGEVGSLETAYRLASYDDKMAASVKQKEQEVLANVTKRGEKQVLPSNDGASNTQFSMENASLDDIRKISERVRRGERITL